MSSIAAAHWENIPQGPVAAAARHLQRTAVYFTGDMSKVVSRMKRCGVAADLSVLYLLMAWTVQYIHVGNIMKN